MKVSARTDYALRAMIELAAVEGQVLSGPEIAERQQIPRQFLDAILGDLRRSGLIASQRGVNGGFRLARPGTEIMIADVMRVADGPLATVRGERPQHLAYDGAAVPLQQVWITVRAHLREVLDHVSIADVARDDLPTSISTVASDPETWT